MSYEIKKTKRKKIMKKIYFSNEFEREWEWQSKGNAC